MGGERKTKNKVTVYPENLTKIDSLHLCPSVFIIRQLTELTFWPGVIVWGNFLLISAIPCVVGWMEGTLERLSPHQAD